MAVRGRLLFCLIGLVSLSLCSTVASLSRSDFSKNFIFGAGSASYQYEGAAFEDGKGPSIWDTFTHQHPAKIADGSNGDMADDFYHRYEEDFHLMKTTGLEFFRFSISWPRILPRGKISGGVNPRGVKFYNNLINTLLAHGIKPFVTIYHWDLPQALQDEYGGFLSREIVKDFTDFSELCFKLFGDRVKHWTTMNEPNIFAENGYARGSFPPGRCSDYIENCSAGNSGTEPYIIGHNLLLSHAAVVHLYRHKYKHGIIGIALTASWVLPINGSSASRWAASRSLDFSIGWFMDPITKGDYPKSMRAIAENRLPKFEKKQSRLLKDSFDFIGLNYYTSYYAYNTPTTGKKLSYTTDSQSTVTPYNNDGVPIGPPTPVDWIYVYPKGLQDLVMYFKKQYNNPIIIITENRVGDLSSEPIKKSLNDTWRIDYVRGHLLYLHESIQGGGNVQGYFVWAFLDDFEWNSGYTVRFGLTLIDHSNGLKRCLKRSALWFKRFLTNNSLFISL